MAQNVGGREQRIRDPVHGVIVFAGGDEFEQLCWKLLNTREFQRLRRIKQLGFSELVYPGATHSRFAHSMGVFHTARQLVHFLRQKLGSDFSRERAEIAACAALLHDVGHGPFSHAFEGVLKKRGKPKKHEKWTVEIIRGDTEIAATLEVRPALREAVASLLEQEHPQDVYASIVSSQFDADRLDYLQRDRLMTGTEYGSFDVDWLMNNLEVAKLTIGGDGESTPFEVDGLILGAKGLQAAESYLLGRFHLYTQVYMHKATRAAEKMLEALLARLADLIEAGLIEETGLSEAHPIARFFAKDGITLSNYLLIDDVVIWGALPQLEAAKDKMISDLGHRLRNRKLFKCVDVGALAATPGSDLTGRFRKLLNEAVTSGRIRRADVLEDRATVSAYKFREYESPDALSKIMIRRPDGSGMHEDVARLSDVVKALGERRLFRVYGTDETVRGELQKIWREAKGDGRG